MPGTQGPLLRLPKASPVPRQAEPRRRRLLLLPGQGVRGQRGSLRPGRALSPGCLFKFGEVGPTPSKGAWGFGVNPCQASQQTPLRRGSPSVKAAGDPGAGEPRSRTGTEQAGAARSHPGRAGEAPAQLWAQAGSTPGEPEP